MNDDYGDRQISQAFFSYKIPTRQKEIAEECRARVAAEVGTYSDLSGALRNNPTPERIRWASNIASSIKTQWVEGDANNAQNSFITINQRSVQIDDTEKYMILARKKPNVIAARALIRCATGHEYWGKFDESFKRKTTTYAKKIYDVLFEPENADIMRTIDMPIAGKPYSADALRLTLELMNFANDRKSKKDIEAIEDDNEHGESTARWLERAYGVVKYLSGNNSASLDLHPAVYFWGATGKHHPSAVLAVVSFVQYLVATEGLIDFCRHRAKFDEFLVNNNSIVKHILGAYGGWKKSAPSVFEMYKDVFNGFKDGKTESEIEQDLVDKPKYSGLAELMTLRGNPGKRPTRETKIAVRRNELLKSALRCQICFARLPSHSISDDHKVRAQSGGRGSEENMQLSHHYCNHGFKEYLVSHDETLPENPFKE